MLSKNNQKKKIIYLEHTIMSLDCNPSAKRYVKDFHTKTSGLVHFKMKSRRIFVTLSDEFKNITLKCNQH